MTAPPAPADATALADAIERGELTAVRALEQTLERITTDPRPINAIASLAADVGRRQAEAIDAEIAACRDDAARHELRVRRPFLGVPLLIKDLGTAAIDLPSRFGSRLSGDHGVSWAVDSAVVARFRRAGFVLFGRSTSPEMGISPSTEALAYGGPTRNPFELDHSAGGSSGGAAAAVAAGWVTIGHANDGAGSIRIPASCCGLVGLKPSRGLVPMGPLVGEGWGGLAVENTVAKSVRDAAIVLDAIAGADPGAPYAAPMPPRTFVSAINEPSPPRRRIVLCNRFFEGDPVDPEVAAAIAALADRLRSLGHDVIDAAPPMSTRQVLEPVMRIITAGTAAVATHLSHQLDRPIVADTMEPATRSAIDYGRRLDAPGYLDAVAAVHTLGRRFAAWFDGHDALLTPTLAELPTRLGRFAMHWTDYLDYRLGPEGLWRYSPFTALANATGGASISVPAGRSASGLPIGAMLTAGIGADATLLQLAADLEAAAT